MSEQASSAPATTRLEAFSDGVLAIVITLMVLEIKIPVPAEGITGESAWLILEPILPKLLAYALSFIMITIFWINHHELFHSIRSASRGLLLLNSLWLFWICLLPFPTAFLGEHSDSVLSPILFGAELFLCSLSFFAIRYYCWKAELFRKNIPDDKSRHLLRKSLMGPILYGCSIGFSFVSIGLSYAIFIVVPVLFIVTSAKRSKK